MEKSSGAQLSLKKKVNNVEVWPEYLKSGLSEGFTKLDA
jgi:hypothetical protein